jgi:hypothetical protein
MLRDNFSGSRFRRGKQNKKARVEPGLFVKLFLGLPAGAARQDRSEQASNDYQQLLHTTTPTCIPGTRAEDSLGVSHATGLGCRRKSIGRTPGSTDRQRTAVRSEV